MVCEAQGGRLKLCKQGRDVMSEVRLRHNSLIESVDQQWDGVNPVISTFQPAANYTA
jgi:hypothetical protein